MTVEGQDPPTEPNRLSSSSRIQALDGLRGIAILLVVIDHWWDAFFSQPDTASLPWFFDTILGNGNLGVRIFFVLSGFLITSLLVQEFRKHGSVSLKRFYLRRVLRIFPAFYVFVATILVLAAFGAIEVSWQQGVAALTYTFNYLHLWHEGPESGRWFFNHLWSLSMEEQFYLFWPFLLLAFGIRKGIRLPILLVLFVPLLRVGSYFLFPDQRPYLLEMFHTGLDPMMMGCLAALARDRGLTKSFPDSRWGPLIAWTGLFVVSPILGERFGGKYVTTVGVTIDSLLAAWIILDLSRADFGTRHPLLRRSMEHPALTLVGRLSYSWYLWQQLFLTRFDVPWTGGVWFSIPLSLLAAGLSYTMIERPFLRLKQRFSGVAS